MASPSRKRAPRNKTLTLDPDERRTSADRLLRLSRPAALEEVLDRTICQDLFEVIDFLPPQSVDLVFADPPYNLSKTFSARHFPKKAPADYETWLESWVAKLPRIMKPIASIYLCGDWQSSASIHRVIEKHFRVRNRITWEREKGRGAARNWKNCSEDIWFSTVSDDYVFNVDAVKLKRRVLAPYTHETGKPKDWDREGAGGYRLTHPSNLWTDLTVPFWSMPENTDHPTQKPEKLVAKAILASSNEGDVVLDPFLGSGTTSVVAAKLGRHFIGIELDEDYCCLAEKRLDLAKTDHAIQGYADGVFWERNTSGVQKRQSRLS